MTVEEIKKRILELQILKAKLPLLAINPELFNKELERLTKD